MTKGTFKNFSEEEFNKIKTSWLETRKMNNEAIREAQKELEFKNHFQEENGFLFDRLTDKIDYLLKIFK